MGVPPLPPHLSQRAQELWHYYSEKLVAEGVLAELEGGILSRYCQAQADVERLTLELLEEGEVIEGSKGTSTKNPKALLLREANDRAYRCECALGLTPVDRARVITRKPTGPNPFDQFG